LLEALENGVSAYPHLEGRFPQVAGIEFGFNPSKPKGQRIDPDRVKVQDLPVDPMKVRLIVISNLQIITDSSCLTLKSSSDSFPILFLNIVHKFSFETCV
jgi:hypothetical protein